MDERVIRNHESVLASVGAKRPAHDLNDRVVTIVGDVAAEPLYKRGPRYTAGAELMVAAVMHDATAGCERAIVVGAYGPATIAASALVTR